MNSVAYAAAVICAVSIGASLMSVILPSSDTRRVMITVLGAFILCSLFFSVKNAAETFEFKFDVPAIQKSLTASADEAYEKAVIKKTKSQLESYLVNYLISKGYKIKSAEIKLNTDDKKGIYTERIRIYIYKSELINAGNIISLTENKFEVKPELTVT